MPIDPSIPLQGRTTVPLADPLEQQAKAMGLRNMATRQLVEQQQLQQGNMALEQQQLEMQDQQKMRQAYMESGGDLAELEKRAMAAGVGPRSMMALKQQLLNTRKTLAQIGKDELEAKKNTTAALGSAAQAVLQLPPDQRAQGWATTRANLISQGHITPDQAPEQYPGDEQLQLHANTARTSQQIIDSILKERGVVAQEKTAASHATQANTQERRLAAELSGIEATNLTKGLQIAGQTAVGVSDQASWDAWRATLAPEVAKRMPPVFSPAAKQLVQSMGMNPDQQVQTALEAKRSEEAKRHNLVEERLGGGRLAVERENSKRMQAQFDATYGALNGPDGKPMDAEAAKAFASQDPAAAAIANYQLAPPSISRGGPGAMVMRKVLAINPDYNAQDWAAQGALLKNFTSGKTADQLRSLNTALGHVGMLTDAIDALKNGNVQVLNSIANRFGAATGSTPATVFQAIVNKVGPEVAAAYGIATGAERDVAKDDFNPKMSPDQLMNNAKTTAKLLGSKIEAAQKQWKDVFKNRPFEPLSPEGARVMQKLGVGGPPANAPASFSITATGADGHKIGSNDGKTWFDVQSGKKLN